MKRNPAILIIIVVVVVLALLIGGAILALRLIYHRSLSATMLAWQFDKRVYLTGEAFDEYMNEKHLENGAPYVKPDDVDYTVPITQELHGSMEVFLLNGAAEPGETVIWYFPGGAYIDQPAESHWTFLNRLAEDTGASIYVPIYPKLPDHGAADAYDAVMSAYLDYMDGTAYGQLVFMGDSAGGGMALSLAMQLRDAGQKTPDQLILLSPWVDVTMENPDIADYEKRDPILNKDRLHQLGELWAADGGYDTTDPVVSPLYGDLSVLGHITLFTTTGEILYPDLLRLRDALEQAGTPCETYIPEEMMFHIWPLFGWMDIPECREAYDAIVDQLLQ